MRLLRLKAVSSRAERTWAWGRALERSASVRMEGGARGEGANDRKRDRKARAWASTTEDGPVDWRGLDDEDDAFMGPGPWEERE